MVNEELQTANEELISGSEELLNLNEELESSKEELQSTNEEISIINQELKSLNDELSEEKEFAEAINKAIHEPLLVMDKNLQIKTANQPFYDTFKVLPEETEGVKIYKLGNDQWNIPALRKLLEAVIYEKQSFVRYAVTHEFEGIGKRDMILNAQEISREDDSKNLILLAIEDVTDLNKNFNSLQDTKDQLYFALEAANLGIWDFNIITSKFTANERLKEWFGIKVDTDFSIREVLSDILVDQDKDRVLKIINDTLNFSNEGEYDITYTIKKTKYTKKRVVRAQGKTFFNKDNEAYRINGTISDVTKETKAAEELKNALFKFTELIQSSPYMFAVLEGPDFILSEANEAILRQLSKGKEIIGKPYLETNPELEEQGLGDLLREVYKTGKLYRGYELPVYLTHNGEKTLAYYNFVYQPQRNPQGEIIGVSIIAVEVTSQAELNNTIKANEYRYQQFIHTSPSLIAIIKGEGLIIETANKAILKIWGKNKDVIGHSLLEVMPELKSQGFTDLLLNVYKTGEPYQAFAAEADHNHNGKMVKGYYDLIYQPQRDEAGEIEGVIVIASDVTKQTKLYQKVRENESRFVQMANMIPDKIATADSDFNPTYYNQSWIDYTGMDMEQIITGGWSQMVHPDDQSTVVKQLKNSLNTGKDIELELRYKDKKGDYLWHLFRSTAVRGENGKIKSWTSASTEIHKLKEEEKRKEDFLKMVSHELKTPITSIKGYVQLLLSMMEDEENIQWEKLPLKPSLTRIDNQISRLTRLIAEMLDLSRLEESALVLKEEKFDLSVLVADTIQDISFSDGTSSIKLIDDASGIVFGDKDRIGQVIINFITNALKYSPNDKNIDVQIFSENEDNISVSVTDHGIGISKADQKNIFKRFYRVTGDNEETYSGFGIGLFLAEEIIIRHNGSVNVESKLGEGSTFTFTLPLVKTT